MDYKKILEGVVNIINTTEKSDIGFANICSYIGENSPELADSEDEKIRKSIIHLVHLYGGEFGMIDANTTVEKAIAWLEKRCTVIKDTISMDVNSETEWDDIHKFLRMNLDGEKVKLLIIREE